MTARYSGIVMAARREAARVLAADPANLAPVAAVAYRPARKRHKAKRRGR